jgi:hypothetical protein
MLLPATKEPRSLSAAGVLDALSEADYPFPSPTLKFLGVIIQRYRLRSGAPTQGFEKDYDRLSQAIEGQLRPSLDKAGVLLPAELYSEAALNDQRWLAAIPDFNTLIADSQRVRKPVFALTQQDARRVGTVWENTEENITLFRKTFKELADRIEILTSAAS